MLLGDEWLVEAFGCDGQLLQDRDRLEALAEALCDELRLKVLQRLWHPFPSPGGVTGLYLLAESHLAIHTFPEFRSATFNLYCCRARPEWPWQEALERALGAERVSVRKISRGRA